MAAARSLKAMRSSLFRLPPHLRAATFTHVAATTKTFSSTSRRNIDPVSILTAGPDFLMDSLHHLGLSWAAVIPCTAILLRGVGTYYLIALPRRRRDRQEAAVRPLIHAYTLMHREQPVEKAKEAKAYLAAGMRGFLQYKVGWRIRANVRGWWELGYLTGINRWQSFGTILGNFGVLIAVMEAIRMKCGRGEGLLSLLLTPITTGWNYLTAGHTQARMADKTSMAQHGGQNVVGNTSVLATTEPQKYEVAGGSVTEVSQNASVDTQSSDETLLSAVDPTLRIEGLPWCPDLTLADPTGILPIGLYFAMAIPAFLSPRPPESFVPQRTWFAACQHKWRTLPFGQKVSVYVAAYFFVVAHSLPAGMVLYLVTSTSMGFLQRVWLDIKYPKLKAITPCIRPVRQKRKRLW